MVCFLTADEMYFDYMYSDIFDRKNQCIRKPCIENVDLINRLMFLHSKIGYHYYGIFQDYQKSDTIYK